MLMEMDDIHFLSSSVMGELVRLHKHMAVQGGLLHLSGLRPNAAKRSASPASTACCRRSLLAMKPSAAPPSNRKLSRSEPGGVSPRSYSGYPLHSGG